MTLTGADTATATFTAPSGLSADAVLTFRLLVTDARGLSHDDMVSVTVLDDVLGVLVLVVDPIAGDGTVDIAEKAAGFAVTGNVTVQGTGTAALDAAGAADGQLGADAGL